MVQREPDVKPQLGLREGAEGGRSQVQIGSLRDGGRESQATSPNWELEGGGREAGNKPRLGA